MPDVPIPLVAIKGRGTATRHPHRYESLVKEEWVESVMEQDDPWYLPDATGLRTQVTTEIARSVITRNDSPDIGFAQSLNPYRGC